MNLVQMRQTLAAAWAQRTERERVAVIGVAALLAALALWFALVPAWRSVRAAPARIAALDAQLQGMQRLAAEVQALRATPPIPPEQATAALQASAARLGAAAQLRVQGERAVLTVTELPGEQLAGWLTETRINARARVVESQLQRTPQGGYAGSVVLALGGGT